VLAVDGGSSKMASTMPPQSIRKNEVKISMSWQIEFSTEDRIFNMDLEHEEIIATS
jgi:hypothetical protein